MNKVHVLPTDKPSRLHYSKVKSDKSISYKLVLNKEPSKCNDGLLSEQRNIYITSDEKLPYNSAIFHTGAFYHRDAAGDVHIINKDTHYPNPNFCSRIILTTDESLFKYGVQAIDDEFLEWFVKNPSCEFVEVKHKDIIQYGNMTMHDHNGDGSYYFCTNCEVEASRSKEELLKFGVEYYKIIIPKEEINLNCFDCNKSLQDCTCMEDTINGFEQETLEEAAERIAYDSTEANKGFPSMEMFKAGGKWQAKRMYSEEDLLSAFEAGMMFIGEDKGSFREWFEQFKKK